MQSATRTFVKNWQGTEHRKTNFESILAGKENKRVGVGDNGVERSLLNSIKRRKLTYFGHLMGKNGDCLEKEFIQGNVPGTRTRGRPRMDWVVNIGAWLGSPFDQTLMDTRDRRTWRKLVHEATNPWIEDG